MTAKRPKRIRRVFGNFVGSLLGGTAAVVAFALLLAALAVPFALVASRSVRAVDMSLKAGSLDLQEPPLPGASVMVASDGQVIARFATFDREPVPSQAISTLVKQALVATEDARFYQHPGVDLEGLGRAAMSNLSSQALQGASTITQQYAKNLLLLEAQRTGDPQAAAEATSRSMSRKIAEARRALMLERKYTKDQILTKYLNLVSFGSNAYGIQAAARRYFSVGADALTLAQAATLVGLLNAPTSLNPLTHPDAALARRNLVLDRMVTAGYVTRAQADAAAREPMVTSPTLPSRGCQAARADWGTYCDAVVRELLTSPLLGPDQATRDLAWSLGGLTIHTALDPKVQAAARTAARASVPPTHRATAVVAVVQPGTGHVAALALSKDFGTGAGHTQLPLASAPVFGPGSTMKLFTLTAALSRGIDLNTRLPGGVSYTSKTLDNPASGAFHNYNSSYASNVTVTQAVQRSLNTAFVQLEEQVGVRPIAQLASSMGARSLPLTGPNAVSDKEGSLTLGAREIPVMEMADAYATIAAGGLACPVTLVTSVDGAQHGGTPAAGCSQVVSPAAARATTWALEQVVRSGTGTSAALADRRPVAGKTGTSQDVASAWFAGFTPQWATAVAVADPRGPRYPLRNTLGHSAVYGGTIPAAIFKSTMDAVHASLPVKELVTDLDPEYLLAQPPSDRAVVPEVTGLTTQAAVSALRQSGLVALARSGQPVGGTVTSTIPKAGTQVAQGAAVQLVTQ